MLLLTNGPKEYLQRIILTYSNSPGEGEIQFHWNCSKITINVTQTLINLTFRKCKSYEHSVGIDFVVDLASNHEGTNPVKIHESNEQLFRFYYSRGPSRPDLDRI